MTNDTPNPANRYTGILLADRYEVGEMIARDALTETHKAQDRELQMAVAIKFLSPQLAEDTVFAERFVDEALWATTIRGPAIISILDAGTSDAMRYVVQEYVEGQTLGQRLRNDGKLDPSTACEIADQVLGALTVAHGVGIVHGGINTTNIVLTGPSSARLLDLGIAHVQSSRTVAETQAMMGHPEYLSPEQAQGDPIELTSDIYSVGIILYEMLTGKPPFSGDSPVAVSYMHIHDIPKPITQITPGVPPAIADTVAKALLKKPEDRYQSAEDFRTAIGLARSGRRESSTPEETTSATAAPATAPAAPRPAAPAPSAPAAAPAPTARPAAPQAPAAAATSRPAEPKTAAAEDMQPKTMVFSPGSAGPGRKIIAAIVVVVVLAAGAAFAFKLVKGSGNTKVPQLAQLPLAKAEETLRQAGLKWRTLDQESSEFAPGSVMGQAPAAGVTVAKGTEMVLTIAKTPTVIRVPDLIGVVSVSAAKDRLDAAGVQMGTITEKPSSSYPGMVIGQDPVGGTIANKDTKVNLVIAAAK